jgi:hypothetical protein
MNITAFGLRKRVENDMTTDTHMLRHDDEARTRSIVLQLVRAYSAVDVEASEASNILDDLGYNSYRVIELFSALQELFSLDAVSVPEISTVAHLQAHVVGALAAGEGELPSADEVGDWLGRL